MSCPNQFSGCSDCYEMACSWLSALRWRSMQARAWEQVRGRGGVLLSRDIRFWAASCTSGVCCMALTMQASCCSSGSSTPICAHLTLVSAMRGLGLVTQL